MMTQQSALLLALWIAKVHPALYAQLNDSAMLPSFGAFGQDDDLDTEDDSGVSVDIGSDIYSASLDLSPSPLDLGDENQSLIDLQQGAIAPVAPVDTGGLTASEAVINAPTSTAPVSAASVTTAAASAGTTASALTAVGNFLSSPQGMTSLANLAGAYFQSQAAQANAQTAQAVLQSQMARANSGLSPAPISYAIGANGQPTPVLSTASGQVPVSRDVLSALTPGGSSTLLWIGAGAVFLLLFMLAGDHGSSSSPSYKGRR